jgi:Tol biopolymer transport system component
VLLALLCLAVGGCQRDGAAPTSAAPCTPVASDGAARRASEQILVVIGADYDEPAGELAVLGEDGRLRKLGPSALEARWSPDGERVAYLAADNFTPETSLWVMDAEGRGGRRLGSAWPGWSHQLEWSPDGSRILFSREGYPSRGAPTLWSIAADGTDLRRVATGVTDAQWSPDGRSVALVREEAIFVAPAAGGDGSRVATAGASPKWTPDGERLVFARARGRSGLYTVPAAGGEPRRVAGGRFDLVDISPDGCSALAADGRGLVAVSLGDGRLRRLTRNPQDGFGDWSPDGRIAFLRADDVWVVDERGTARAVREAPRLGVFTQVHWQP